MCLVTGVNHVLLPLRTALLIPLRKRSNFPPFHYYGFRMNATRANQVFTALLFVYTHHPTNIIRCQKCHKDSSRGHKCRRKNFSPSHHFVAVVTISAGVTVPVLNCPTIALHRHRKMSDFNQCLLNNS